MNFGGHLKVTLLDFPNHVATTIFTNGCNMRCPFCHNAHLVSECDQVIATDEIVDYLNKRKNVLEGVCISGGEPLLQKDVVEFITMVKGLGYKVKLDTNGTSYDKLKYLVDNHLVDYVAMDIKNTPEKYGITIGKEGFDITPVLQSVEILKKGSVPYEFRTTVTLEFHTENDIEEIGKWLGNVPKYFLQNFTDSGELIDPNVHGHDKNSMNSMLTAARKHISATELRGL